MKLSGRTRRFSLATLRIAAVATVPLAGCASQGSSVSAPPPAKAAAAPGQPATQLTADARFTHSAMSSAEWAIHMSDLVIKRTSRKDVRAIAHRIKTREEANLQLLANERTRLGLSSGPAPDHHADAHLHMDESRLSVAKGDEADSIYIEHMIDQRRDVIAMANTTDDYLTSPTLAYLADQISEERQKDISELSALQSVARSVPSDSRAQRGIQTTRGTTTTTSTGRTSGRR